MTANAESLFAWVPRQRERWLNLWIAGRVFGGRPGEAPLEIANATFDGATARLYFDGGEVLVVERPSEFVTADGGLTIPDAIQVRFGWYWYGSEQAPENWCELVYTLMDDEVSVTATGPAASWHPSSHFSLDKQPMVRLSSATLNAPNVQRG